MNALTPQTHRNMKRPRDPRIDTLRGIFIILVVFGHLTLRFVTRSSIFELVYWWTYLIHMPGFATLSGIVITDAKRSARTAIRSLLPLYLGFSLLHIGMRAFEVTGGRIVWEPLWAPGLHWYLLSLLLWRLMLPYARRFPMPLVLVCSIGVSLLIGWVTWLGPLMSLSRTIVYWPFFFAGNFLGMGGFAHLSTLLKAWMGGVFLSVYALIGFSLWATEGFRISQLTGKLPYASTSDHWVYPLIVRIAAVACTTLVILAGAVLLPSRESVFSRIGADSLPVYLLHLYLIYPLDHIVHHIASPILMAAIICAFTPLCVALTHTRFAHRFVVSYSALCQRLFDTIVDALRTLGGRDDTVRA